MDREYGQPTPQDSSTNDAGLGVRDFGMSLAVGPVPNVQAIGSKLRAGGKTLEIGFTGTGKGTGQSQTPEYYGKKQRQALIEMARSNKVDFTTHSAFGVQGLAGMDQQGNFSKTAKSFSINEIKRAIEFAADVGQGGPVVVHTGEFNRPIVDSEWNQKDDTWKNKFKAYEDEEKRATFRVIDDRHGGTVMEARKSRPVTRPVWLRSDKDYSYVDKETGKTIHVKKDDYIDYEDKKIDRAHRVPVFDEKAQHFKVEQLDWNDLQKEADEMTREAREYWRQWKRAPEEQRKKLTKESRWSRYFDEKLGEEDIKVRPEEAYVVSQLETNAANNRGWSYYYGRGFDENIEQIKKLRKALEFYEKLEKATDPEEKWRLKRMAEDNAPGLVPPETKFPSEILKRRIGGMESHIKQAQESAASQWAQAEEADETIKHVQSAEGYALQEAYDSYAQAGIFAMRHSDRLEKEKKLKKPLAIAMENLFPENYGAHPDEITQLVVKSREKMAELLQKNMGYSGQQAQKEAQEHITATIDTGHLNVWRKYWQADTKKSIAENDADFNKWLMEKMDVMIKNNVVGHMHLDDNYGYHDDHLAPGEGNTPIKEIVELLKKRGYKGELIVEPGADWTTDLGGFHSVMKTWRLFGSPLYGAAPGVAPGMRTWGQVQYGWFGQNQPPYFVFNPYTPSEDWTLWSGVPLE